jgi:hypothetical protein
MEEIDDWFDPITPWFRWQYNEDSFDERMDAHKRRCDKGLGRQQDCPEYDSEKENYGYWNGVGDSLFGNDPQQDADSQDRTIRNRLRGL